MALIKCSKCGKDLSDKASICPSCGASIQEIMMDYIKLDIETEYKEKEKELISEISEKYQQEYEQKLQEERVHYKNEFEQKLKEQKLEASNNENVSSLKMLKVIIGIETFCIIVLVCLLIRSSLFSKEPQAESSDFIEEVETIEDLESLFEKESETISAVNEEFKIGEIQCIHTDYGDFKIEFDHVRLSDWEKRSGEEMDGIEIILVECTIENINYNNPYNSIFWLNNHMAAVDDESFVIERLSWSYDDGEYISSPEIPEGTKAKVCVPLKVREDSKEITFTFDDGNYITTEIEK